MNKLLYLLFALVLGLTACKPDKEKDPEPAKPAVAVAGNYTLSSLRITNASGTTNLPTLPTTRNGRTISGNVVLTQISGQDTQVTLKLTLKVTGEQDGSIEIDQVTVEPSGGAYTLKIDGESVGTLDGSTLNFSLSETDQQGRQIEISFTGRK